LWHDQESRGLDFWHELAIAFCLMLIIEGIIPFLAPHRWRKMVVMVAKVDDFNMRAMGLLSMLAGTGILYLIK